MCNRSIMLSQLEELAEFHTANDERGTAFLSGHDLAGLDTGEIVEQIAFLRTWAGAVQILSLADPRPTAMCLDNAILRLRLAALDEELGRRRRESWGAS